jgi:hypothetical protein
MGYRGEDASRGPADSRRQQPWQSYGQDAGDAPADGRENRRENNGQGWQQEYGNTGGYPEDGGHAQSGEYAQPGGYPESAGGYPQPGGHAPDGYGSAGPGAYNDPAGYGNPGRYGGAGSYAGPGGLIGQGLDGYPGAGEPDPRSAHGPYGQPDTYGQPSGYGQQPDFGQPASGQPAPGQSAYRQPGYGQPEYGQPGYGQGDHGRGQFPGTGGYAENDWYGGGASGGGFADTSTDLPAVPNRGGSLGNQPPRPAARAALPPALPPTEGTPGLAAPPSGLSQTRQQQALGDDRHVTYPGYEGLDDEGGYGGSGGYAAQQGSDDYDDYAAHGYDEPGPAGQYGATDQYGGTGEYSPVGGTGEFGTSQGYDDGPALGGPREYGTGAYDTGAYDTGTTAMVDDYGDGGFGGQGTQGQPALGKDDYGQDDYQGQFGEDEIAGPGFDDPDDQPVGPASPAPRAKGRPRRGQTGGRPTAAGTGPRPRPGISPKSGKSRARRRIIVSGVAVLCLVVALGAVYMLILKPKSSSGNVASPNAPLPSAGSKSGASTISTCQKKLGEYCHIELRSDDPTPLTVTEVFPPIFLNKTDKLSFQRIATRTDTSNHCASAVFGSDLVSQLQQGDCTQFLRATYVAGSGKNEIVGTIGVGNLSTTNDAHHAGRVVGTNDFIAPVTTSSGAGKNVGQGSGLSQSSYKGHYVILMWAQFADSSSSSSLTSAQQKEITQFENDLLADTVNIALSDRMVTGKPSTAGI